MMDRRRFIIISCLTTATLSATIGYVVSNFRVELKRWLLPFLQPSAQEFTQAVRSAFPYLTIQSETCISFLQQYTTAYNRQIRLPLDTQTQKIFLLSTNFVQNGGNTAVPISYVSLYAPYYSPCYNPYMQRRSTELNP